MAGAPTLGREVPRLAAAGQPALRALAPLLRTLGPSAVLLARTMRPLGGLAAYLARYPTEITSGIGAYYAAWIYRPRVGREPGAPVAPSLLVLTCSKAPEVDPPPGQYLTEHTPTRCP